MRAPLYLNARLLRDSRTLPGVIPTAAPISLPGGVMVAQATLTRLVVVRSHAGQPSQFGGTNYSAQTSVREVALVSTVQLTQEPVTGSNPVGRT